MGTKRGVLFVWRVVKEVWSRGGSFERGRKEGVGLVKRVGFKAWGWFEDNLLCKVGNGDDTLLWTDRWLGNMSLRDRFHRLLDLATN
jgi:hypothetical protein